MSTMPSSTIPSSTTNSAGGDFSVQSADESSSHFNWERTGLMIVWAFFLAITLLLAVISCQKARRSRRSTAKNDHPLQWHARTQIVISFFSLLAALSLSIAPHVNCQFIYVSDDRSSSINIDALGIWNVLSSDGNGGNGCFPYPYFTDGRPVEDAAVRATRAIGIIALVLGGAAVAYHFMASFALGFSQRFLPHFLVFVGVVQAFTLILFQTAICDVVTCQLAEGSLASITAIMYWLLGAWSVGLQHCKREVPTIECSNKEESAFNEP